MHFWFRLEHFNSSGLDLSLSLIILRIQLCVRKDLHAVSSILIQSSQKQNQSKLYHINIFLHSLWILWAPTGLGCKLKKIDRKKKKTWFPIFLPLWEPPLLKARGSVVHYLGEWLRLNTGPLGVAVRSDTEDRLILNGGLGRPFQSTRVDESNGSGQEISLGAKKQTYQLPDWVKTLLYSVFLYKCKENIRDK